MKKYLIILGLFVLVAACNQNEDGIPSSVKKQFSKDYPEAQNPEWEIEGEYFEVEASVEGVNTSITYDAEGNVIEKEVEIGLDELPEAAMAYLQNNFPGTILKEIEKGESKEDGNFIEVEILQGTMELEVYFDETGNFTKIVQEEPEEGEENEKGLNIVIEKPEPVEEETPVSIEELPESIITYVTENYPDQKITEAEMEMEDEGTFYEVEITDEAGEEIDLIFDMEGNFIEVEQEEEDMEEDK